MSHGQWTPYTGCIVHMDTPIGHLLHSTLYSINRIHRTDTIENLHNEDVLDEGKGPVTTRLSVDKSVVKADQCRRPVQKL